MHIKHLGYLKNNFKGTILFWNLHKAGKSMLVGKFLVNNTIVY